MRRGVLVMAGMAVGVLLLSVFFQDLGSQTGVLRYQQHREQPSEEELGPCAVCGGEAELCTHLPIISIETGGQTIPGRPYMDPDSLTEAYYTGDNGEEEILVQYSTVAKTGVWHHRDDASTDEGTALLRYRGNSSRWFIKGSFSFKLVDQKKPEQKEREALLGMNPGSSWVLHGPCLDRTLMRNYLCYSIAGQVMGYAPNCRFCELYIQGEYQGVYLLTESISRSEGRIELTESTASSPLTSWLIRFDREFKANHPLDSFSFYTFRLDTSQADLLYPGEDTITPEKFGYVVSDLNEIERSLYAENGSRTTEYSEYLDKSEFAKYFILNEFFGNVDAGKFSTYYYKDMRGKMTPVVWDFNNACDNYINYLYGEDGFNLNQDPLFNTLLTHEDFVEEVINQYRRLRKTCLSEINLMDLIDDTMSYLGTAIDRNNAAWSSLYDMNQYNETNYLSPVSRNYQSYQEAVLQLKTWITKRGQWMDENIDSLRQYCHTSRFANRAAE